MLVDISLKIKHEGSVFMIMLEKNLRLSVLDKTEQAIYRTTITDELVASLKAELSIESDNKSFFELLRSALLLKNFALLQAKSAVTMQIKYKITEGLYLKGNVKLPKLCDSKANPLAFSQEIVGMLENFFPALELDDKFPTSFQKGQAPLSATCSKPKRGAKRDSDEGILEEDEEEDDEFGMTAHKIRLQREAGRKLLFPSSSKRPQKSKSKSKLRLASKRR